MRWSFTDYNEEKYFKNLNMYKLDMDEFYVTFNHNLTTNTNVYSLHRDCLECPYSMETVLSPRNLNSSTPENTTHQFKTDLKFRLASGYPNKYLPQDETQGVLCELNTNFGQFGVYNVNVNESECDVRILKEPVNIYNPIITVLLIYLVFFAIIYGCIIAWHKLKKNKEHEPNHEVLKKTRIKCIDTFRGVIIVLMIFINFGCGNYSFIKHIPWNGLHIADVVFPCFVWIMGVCIAMSLTSNYKKAIPRETLLLNIIKRSVTLFFIGLFLQNDSPADHLRIFGILQRLGVAYLVVATICLHSLRRPKDEKEVEPSALEDITILYKGWIVVFTIVIVHTIIIFCVAAPRCPKGYLGPGGLHKNRSFAECTGGATGYIDGLILNHHRRSIKTIYFSTTFEHVGIVGCMTTIFQVYIGVQAGVTMIVYKTASQRIFRWLIWAAVCGLLGGGLCGFSKEDGIIPINWKLWSLSFVLVTSSIAFVVLSILYILVDLKKWWSGKPFLFAGMNSLLMYIGHHMTARRFPIRWPTGNENHFEALLSDCWGTGMWILISYYLYKINYFFNV